MIVERRKVTPPELAQMWGIGADKVLAWIKSGELRAVNIASGLKNRRRWVIDQADIIEFERKRSSTANVVTATATRQRKRKDETVGEYF
jgi:hypothetical protein